VILFLDFDGVLHPEVASLSAPGILRREGDFSRVPQFEMLMREFPDIDIVISSAWRELNSLETLRGFFSPDIARRIIGATPVLHLEFEGRREREIRAWLRDTGREHEAFIAVDDWPALFSWNCDFLFTVDPERALDRQTIDALRQRLARMHTRRSPP
jgi:hypothetical protein